MFGKKKEEKPDEDEEVEDKVVLRCGCGAVAYRICPSCNHITCNNHWVFSTGRCISCNPGDSIRGGQGI